MFCVSWFVWRYHRHIRYNAVVPNRLTYLQGKYQLNCAKNVECESEETLAAIVKTSLSISRLVRHHPKPWEDNSVARMFNEPHITLAPGGSASQRRGGFLNFPYTSRSKLNPLTKQHNRYLASTNHLRSSRSDNKIANA